MDKENLTFLFSRNKSIVDGQYQNFFSTPSFTRFPTIKNCAVVEHLGNDSGAGTWKCNRDNGAALCAHIVSAHHTLQQYLQGDCEAQDKTVGKNDGGATQYNGQWYPFSWLIYWNQFYFEETPLHQMASVPESVSYQCLSPLCWARILSDPPAKNRVTLDVPPTLFSLGNGDSCCCTRSRELFNPLGPTFQKECIIYTLTSAFKAVIILQKCSQCTHWCIGPECSALGIFNFNNWSLFTHNLLDNYTSAFSLSETPFVLWVQTVSRRYQTRGLAIQFANKKLFWSSWFSYVRLIDFGNDMVCPSCGPNPDSTIWDGVTVSFSWKNLMPMLWPPTTIGNNSVSRSHVHPIPNLQAIPNRNLWLLVCNILQGPHLTTISEGAQPEGSPEYERNQRMVERLSQIPDLVVKLLAIDLSLGCLFNTHVGIAAIFGKKDAHKVYSKFFIQV